MRFPFPTHGPANGPGWPIAATLLGIALFSVMDALMKRAAIGTGVYTALLARSAIGALALAPLWLACGDGWPRAQVLRLHVLRSALVAGMAASFFWGLVRIPLAEGIALSFIAPLIALGLAAAVLGEHVRRSAVGAALLGLGGVIVIAAGRIGDSPRDGDAGRAIGSVLLSAALYACNLVVQRRQAQLASPLDVAFFQNALIGLILLPFLPWLWQTPTPAILAASAAAAALASTSLMLLSWAYGRAETQVLVPIEYTAFLWAALMGWLWFDEAVTVPTLAGAGLIVGAVWIAGRSAAAGQDDPREPAAAPTDHA